MASFLDVMVPAISSFAESYMNRIAPQLNPEEEKRRVEALEKFEPIQTEVYRLLSEGSLTEATKACEEAGVDIRYVAPVNNALGEAAARGASVSPQTRAALEALQGLDVTDKAAVEGYLAEHGAGLEGIGRGMSGYLQQLSQQEDRAGESTEKAGGQEHPKE